MSTKNKKINLGVLVSGGDCQVINTTLGVFMKNTSSYNLYLIFNGYEGLFKNEIVSLELYLNRNTKKEPLAYGNQEAFNDREIQVPPQNIEETLDHFFPFAAGSLIKTSRFSSLRLNIEKCEKNLKKHQIEKLIVLGGDGSIKGARLFRNAFTIPCSIDNDTSSFYSLGFFTAVQQVFDYINNVQFSNQAMGRNAVYEVMGAGKDFIAVLSCFALYCDGLVMNEKLAPHINKKDLKRQLGLANSCFIGSKRKIFFAEHSIDNLLSELASKTNISVILSEKNKNYSLEAFENDNTRLIKIGFIQRGGIPTFTDRKLAILCAHEAIKQLFEKEAGDFVIDNNMKIKLLDRAGSNQEINNIFTNNITKMMWSSVNINNEKIILIRDNPVYSVSNLAGVFKHYNVKEILRLQQKDRLSILHKKISSSGNVSATLTILKDLPSDVLNNNLVVLGDAQDILDLSNTNNIVIPIVKLPRISNFILRETILNAHLSLIDNIVKRNQEKTYRLKCEKWIMRELKIVYDFYIDNKNNSVKIAFEDGSNIIIGENVDEKKGIISISPPVVLIENVIDRVFLRSSLILALTKNGGVILINRNKTKFVRFNKINYQ